MTSATASFGLISTELIPFELNSLLPFNEETTFCENESDFGTMISTTRRCVSSATSSAPSILSSRASSSKTSCVTGTFLKSSSKTQSAGNEVSSKSTWLTSGSFLALPSAWPCASRISPFLAKNSRDGMPSNVRGKLQAGTGMTCWACMPSVSAKWPARDFMVVLAEETEASAGTKKIAKPLRPAQATDDPGTTSGDNSIAASTSEDVYSTPEICKTSSEMCKKVPEIWYKDAHPSTSCLPGKAAKPLAHMTLSVHWSSTPGKGIQWPNPEIPMAKMLPHGATKRRWNFRSERSPPSKSRRSSFCQSCWLLSNTHFAGSNDRAHLPDAAWPTRR